MLLLLGVLPAFSCSALGASLVNMALFRVLRAFLEGFMGFVWVWLSWCFAWIVGLLCACGVRRFWGLLRVCLCFYPFVLCFYPFVLCFSSSSPIFWGFVFVVLGLSCLFVLFVLVSLWVFVFSFSLTDYMQKERAQRFCSLRPLFVCCECSNSCNVIEKLRCRCFGSFQFVRLVFPTNTTRVRRLARSYFYPFRHYVDITYNPSAFLK